MKPDNRREDDQLKEIPKWTRRYAQNRTLAFFLFVISTAILTSLIIGIPVFIGTLATNKKNVTLGVLSIILFVVLGALVFYVLKSRGQQIYRWIDKRIYNGEGTASASFSKTGKSKNWLELTTGIIYMILLLATMNLCMHHYISYKYVQPVSALYIVPFWVLQYFFQRPKVGVLVLINPLLYTLHAILILAGVPLYFTGDFGIFSLFAPLLGYGIIAHIIVHIYNRYALKKLKALAAINGEAADGV